jgi:hypothetical protein
MCKTSDISRYSCRVTRRIEMGAMLTVLIALSLGQASLGDTVDNSANAALHYWVAFALCPRETAIISAATSDDETVGFGVPVGEELARNFRGKGERALEHFHRGAGLASCDWGTDLRKDGPSGDAIHGEKAHALARIALLRARWRFEHGDWDAGIDDVVATMMLGRHIGRDKIWINVHFGCMLEGMATGTVAVYLPRMPEPVRTRLVVRLDGLPTPTSMREVILYQENAIDWAVNKFKQKENEGKLCEFVASFASKDEAKRIMQFAGNAEGLVRLAQAGRPLVRQLAEATSLRPDEYDRMYKKRFAPALEANPVAAMLGSPYELARDEEAIAHCHLLFIKAAIDVLGRGETALSDHRDPYGDGSFGYAKFDGGFELTSKLVYGELQIRMDIGWRKTSQK